LPDSPRAICTPDRALSGRAAGGPRPGDTPAASGSRGGDRCPRVGAEAEASGGSRGGDRYPRGASRGGSPRRPPCRA